MTDFDIVLSPIQAGLSSKDIEGGPDKMATAESFDLCVGGAEFYALH